MKTMSIQTVTHINFRNKARPPIERPATVLAGE